MCIGFIQRTFDDEHRRNRPPDRFREPAKKKLGARLGLGD
jgi:hypothetical protein